MLMAGCRIDGDVGTDLLAADKASKLKQSCPTLAE